MSDLVGNPEDRFSRNPAQISTIDLSEIETVFNGIISMMLLVPAEQAEEPVVLFCQKVAKFVKGDKKGNIRIKMYVCQKKR